MRRAIMLSGLMLAAVVGHADDGAPAPGPAPAAPITRIENSTDGVRFATEAKWVVAGYNDEEIVYTIFITNQDARIIRCTTDIKGSYFENGQKLEITDRQITTVFPDQQAQAGNWMGMDQKSGATYAVKCRPV